MEPTAPLGPYRLSSAPMAKRIVAVCLDFGDTLSDEATEARDEAGTLASIS